MGFFLLTSKSGPWTAAGLFHSPAEMMLICSAQGPASSVTPNSAALCFCLHSPLSALGFLGPELRLVSKGLLSWQAPYPPLIQSVSRKKGVLECVQMCSSAEQKNNQWRPPASLCSQLVHSSCCTQPLIRICQNLYHSWCSL